MNELLLAFRPWFNPGDISLTITPEHLFWTLVVGFVSIGIPILGCLWKIMRFMWDASRFMQDMKSKTDMMWHWFCNEHGIQSQEIQGD